MVRARVTAGGARVTDGGARVTDGGARVTGGGDRRCVQPSIPAALELCAGCDSRSPARMHAGILRRHPRQVPV